MRKCSRSLIVVGLLFLAACGDKTVTSQPADTSAPAVTSSAGDAVSTANVDEDFTVVEQLLRDVDGDITATDQDRATPEGDPTE